MKNPFFTGACTALVTPFHEGKINYAILEELLHRQIEAGIEAVVMAGTTGEAPTLSDAEKLEMFRRAKQYTGDDCIIIAGTGSNDTRHAQWLSMEAMNAGADALLIVSPYYNKATQTGLLRHYETIADSVDAPLILYNVPSRTGVAIAPETYATLAQHPNIYGVKEASGDLKSIQRTRNLCPDDFKIR